MLLPESTCTEPAFNVTPAPCQVPFTCEVLLMDCSTTLEFAVTRTAPLTVTVEPPPIVNIAPFTTDRLVRLWLPVGQVVLLEITTLPVCATRVGPSAEIDATKTQRLRRADFQDFRIMASFTGSRKA